MVRLHDGARNQGEGLMVSRLVRNQKNAGSTPATLTPKGRSSRLEEHLLDKREAARFDSGRPYETIRGLPTGRKAVSEAANLGSTPNLGTHGGRGLTVFGRLAVTEEVRVRLPPITPETIPCGAIGKHLGL